MLGSDHTASPDRIRHALFDGQEVKGFTGEPVIRRWSSRSHSRRAEFQSCHSSPAQVCGTTAPERCQNQEPSFRPEAHMNGLRQLGWPHYLLLTAILGSLLAILGVVLLAGPLLR